MYTFKSGFSDQQVKVRTTHQPGIIDEACGIYYNQFTVPQNVSLKNDPFGVGAANNRINTWMELITPTTAKVLAYYDHPVWNQYAAITENNYGKGLATYIGCIPSDSITEKVLADAVKKAGLWGKDQELHFPVVIKSGVNRSGKAIHYYLNYSPNETGFSYTYKNGKDLLSGENITGNSQQTLKGWGVKIVEEE